MCIYHGLAAPREIGEHTCVFLWAGWSRGGTGRSPSTSVAGVIGKREKWLRSDGGARRVPGISNSEVVHTRGTAISRLIQASQEE